MASENQPPLTDQLIWEMSLLLAPLRRLDDGASVFRLMRDLGWQLPDADVFETGFPQLATHATSLMEKVFQIGNAAPEERLELFKELSLLVRSVFISIRATVEEIKTTLQKYGNYFYASGIEANFVDRLIDYLIVMYIQTNRPKLFSILNLLGLVEICEVNVGDLPILDYEPSRPYSIKVVHWDRMLIIFSDPAGLASDVYQWDDKDEFQVDLFLQRVELVMRCFNLLGGIYKQDATIHGAINPDSSENREIRIPLYHDGEWPDSYVEAGLNIAPLDGCLEPTVKPKGIAVIPYLFGLASIDEAIGENWEFVLEGTASLDGGLGLLIRPPHDVEIKTSLFKPPATNGDGRVELSIRRKENIRAPLVIFGSDASSLSVERIGGRFLAATSSVDNELAAELEIEGLRLVIDASEADGFLQKILPAGKIESIFNLTIGLSNKDGLHFGGSGGRDVTIPIHEKVGPVELDSIFLSLQLSRDIDIVFAASLRADLGPISVSVERIGLSVPIHFPEDRKGNLGPIDVPGVKFTPPKGAGISINASRITGGGFLDFDQTNKSYTGIIQLNAGGLDLVGIGLIATQMPDGSDGFSLLISITGKDITPPIQLPCGFSLSGVGGLIALNRSMDIEFLRTGLRENALDSILFPENPLANAGTIISNLHSAFPPVNGHVIIGPMVKLNWGTPRIIQADIGIFIELPELRPVLLGQITATLPQEQNAIIEIHIDVLGVINFENETLAIDATLFNSRIYEYPLSGDSALRFSWGNSPYLVLSLGGFHPRFSPPAGFPTLRRLTLNLSQGRDLQLVCTAYHAITSNTIQFGAAIALLVRKSGAKLEGRLSFDTLICLSPFGFDVDIRGCVVARYKGHRLASVRLHMLLSGPTPWHARGRATFGILCWDVSVRFNETWGPRTPLEIPPEDAWPKLKAALEQDDSWGARLPSGIRAVEILSLQKGQVGVVLVHPGGSLEVRQNVLPLEIELQKLGGAPLLGQTYFSIDEVMLVSDGGVTKSENVLDTIDVEDDFAPAQFLALSDSERLSKPAFEKMKAGVSIVASGIDFGSRMATQPHNYESIMIKDDGTSGPIQLTEMPHMDTEALKVQLQSSAAGRCQLTATGRSKYHVPEKPQLVKLAPEHYEVINTDTMASPNDVPDRKVNMGRIQAEQAALAYCKINPSSAAHIKVVRAREVTR